MGYLTTKYKGKYRLKCEVDKVTNDFPKTLKDTYEDADVYIDCSFGNKIFYYGKGILQSYIPSLQRGRNIIRKLYTENINPENVSILKSGKGTTYKIIDHKNSILISKTQNLFLIFLKQIQKSCLNSMRKTQIKSFHY